LGDFGGIKDFWGADKEIILFFSPLLTRNKASQCNDSLFSSTVSLRQHHFLLLSSTSFSLNLGKSIDSLLSQFSFILHLLVLGFHIEIDSIEI